MRSVNSAWVSLAVSVLMSASLKGSKNALARRT